MEFSEPLWQKLRWWCYSWNKAFGTLSETIQKCFWTLPAAKDLLVGQQLSKLVREQN